MSHYKVQLTKITTSSTTLSVSAKSAVEAREIAELEAHGIQFDKDSENTDIEIVEVAKAAGRVPKRSPELLKFLVVATVDGTCCSACVEAADRESAIAAAGGFNGYDPESASIEAVYRIDGDAELTSGGGTQ